MSLPAKTRTGTAPLAGVDEISLAKNAVLKFSYPNLDDPLYIHSGANSIKWSFVLNTQTTPTLGGEVVQVLSAMVGPITITGQTAGLRTNQDGKLGPNQIPGWKNLRGKEAFGPYHELQAIMAWFRKYITIAGTDRGGVDPRNRSIRFTYPERGWDFYIQPTQLTGFRYDRAVISPQWSITAEIVSNNGLDYFSGVTMSSFTDELLTTNTKLQGQIGLSNFANTTTETNNPNFGQTGDHGSTNPFLNPDLSGSALSAVKKMGDNFQGLVAAWSQGDFAHFGFGAMLDNNALPKNVDAVYQKLFGNTLLGSITATTSGGGTSGGGTYTYSGSNSQDSVAVQIANAFAAKNMPPELGIAVGLHESTLNPDAYQGDYVNTVQGDGAVGLFQTFYRSLATGGAGAGAGLPHAGELKAAQAPLTLGQSPPSGYKVTKYYPTADQVSDGAAWFKADKPGWLPGNTDSLSDDQLAQWAMAAQRGDGYVVGNGPASSSSTCQPIFSQDIAKAKSILKQLTVSGGSATGLRASVLAWVAKADSYGKITWSEACNRNVESYKAGNWPSLLDCSTYAALMYWWGTNNHKYALNGGTYNGTTTFTIANTWKSAIVDKTKARAGDLVVWEKGDLNLNHAAILIEDWGGDSTKISSLGSGVGPIVETFGGENQYHPTNTPFFYSILP